MNRPDTTFRDALAQEQFLTVLPREEAVRRFESALSPAPVGTERAELSEALGRVLAEDVASPGDVPPFDRSAVDGFAVRAADIAAARETAPVSLRLNDEIVACGVAPTGVVAPGTATAVATGAPIPRGADAVVMVEQTDPDEDAPEPRIAVRRAAAPGQFVGFAGSDIAGGETLLRRGTVIGSREIGMLAACGLAAIPVFRRPRVGVLSTGDELVAPGRPLPPAAIHDANGPIVNAAVAENGGEPVFYGAVPDDEAALDAAIRRAHAECDMVILSGGTSKGAGDLTYRLVSRLGPPGIVAHGVALKPGKPLCLAVCGGKAVIVLPGFPTSAMFTFHDIVAPVLRRMAGLPARREAQLEARVPVRIASELGRTEFVMVSLVEGEGRPVAYPVGKGSGSVTAFAGADGFITVEALADAVPADSDATVTLFTPHVAAPDLVVMGSHDVGLDSVIGRVAEGGLQRARDGGRQPRRARGGAARRVRPRADSPPRSANRALQPGPYHDRPDARRGLAAHAGDRVPPRRSALHRSGARGGRGGGARRLGLPHGQPQSGRRHPHPDRSPARRRAPGRLLEPAALAQRGRGRGRAGARRLGRRHRAGGERLRARLHSDRRGALRFRAGRGAPHPAGRGGLSRSPH